MTTCFGSSCGVVLETARDRDFAVLSVPAFVLFVEPLGRPRDRGAGSGLGSSFSFTICFVFGLPARFFGASSIRANSSLSSLSLSSFAGATVVIAAGFRPRPVPADVVDEVDPAGRPRGRPTVVLALVSITPISSSVPSSVSGSVAWGVDRAPLRAVEAVVTVEDAFAVLVFGAGFVTPLVAALVVVVRFAVRVARFGGEAAGITAARAMISNDKDFKLALPAQRC